jgi:L-lactate dehydrogenase complex protein LldG
MTSLLSSAWEFMTARDDILRSIRRSLPQASALPGHAGGWISYPDLVHQFAGVLEAVGGMCHCVHSIEEIPPLLGDLVSAEKVVASTIPGLLSDRFDLASVSEPHQLQDVDLAILPGELAVAENGAVWVSQNGLRHRVLFFLCQHLALVVPRSALVPHLHEAYERLNIGNQPFGCFISGPSKTADIEQSLVKGAHGARTLNVFLVDQF